MTKAQIEISEILQLQANRYPMLFIDRVLSCEPMESSRCLKNFSYNSGTNRMFMNITDLKKTLKILN